MSKSEIEKTNVDASVGADEGDDAIIGQALRWSLAVFVPMVVVVIGVVVWLNRPKPPPKVVPTVEVAADVRKTDAKVPLVKFTDITRDAGITFKHENGAYGDKLLPETMGGGVAFLDYDNDGDQDLLLVNSSHWPGKQPKQKPMPIMALYQNSGMGLFTDVTASVGLDITMYGMGVAVGDYDNDGWRDVFISAVGHNRLLRNENGKFVDVTQRAGVAGDDDQWSTSCGWFDYDNDGRLDLFVCNYIDWSKEIDLKLNSTLDGVNRAYGPPTHFEGAFPFLYHNEGDGRFTDVSELAGVRVKNHLTSVPLSKSLGVVFVDLDEDGWMDIVVANDTVQNLVFHNQRTGEFKEIGQTIGLAFNSEGRATGAMGIDAGRIRESNGLALCIGNFATEPISLYVTLGDAMLFSDEAMSSGLGPQTQLELTFGLFFFDYDLDGRLDLLAANGHLEEEINKVQSHQHYQQPPQLFWNAGTDANYEFVTVDSDKIGPDFRKPMVGRGAAFADIDNDGDLDVIITATGASPRLLRNDQNLENHWLRFALIGSKCNRDAIGAWIDVHLDGQVIKRQVAPTRSYLSQVELPVTIGIGEENKVVKVVIRWPDGSSQELLAPAINRLHVVTQSKE